MTPRCCCVVVCLFEIYSIPKIPAKQNKINALAFLHPDIFVLSYISRFQYFDVQEVSI